MCVLLDPAQHHHKAFPLYDEVSLVCESCGHLLSNTMLEKILLLDLEAETQWEMSYAILRVIAEPFLSDYGMVRTDVQNYGL